MTIEDCELYWVLLETELSNEELYLPPDTPLGKVNPRRLYKILKHRHARQRTRLIKQQVAELNEYQLQFSKENGQDYLFNKVQPIACESISGSDFLSTCQDDINELLANIPTYIQENQQQREESYSEREIRENEEREAEDRKQDLLKILQKKHRSKFEELETKHQEQIDALLEYQKSELTVIPADILDPVVPAITRERTHSSRISSTSPPVNSRHGGNSSASSSRRTSPSSTTSSSSRHRFSTSPSKRPIREEEKFSIDKAAKKAKRRGEEEKEREHHSSSSSSRRHREKAKKSVQPIREEEEEYNRLSESGKQTKVDELRKSLGLAPPITIPLNDSTSSNKQQKHNYPASTYRPGSPTNTAKGPPTGSAAASSSSSPRPPMVASSSTSNRGPPTVQSSSTQQQHPLFARHQEARRSSSTPLFNKSALATTALMDTGDMLIKSKPNRVIIRGPNGIETVYGNPKDYDDAMNSSKKRDDNPVHKRRLYNQDYLFYKTESNYVVTVGPVSKIQPLIHKFFLSM